MAERVTVIPDKIVDPNATPRVDIVPGPNGGVKVDPALTPAPVVKTEGERPAWLPAKFKTAEEMAASYAELEKKQSSAVKPAPVTTVTAETVKAAGLDLPALSKEFAQKGELSVETLKSLADKGFDKASVDSYIAGQQAVAEKMTTSLETIAGGKAELAAVLAWAKTNLDADVASAYDAAYDSGNLGQLKLALQGVISQYTEANGKAPSLVVGGQGARSTDAIAFESNKQIIDAMSSKEYKTDPAFREKVYRRIAVTGPFTSTR